MTVGRLVFGISSLLALVLAPLACAKAKKPTTDEHGATTQEVSVGDLAPDFSATTHSGEKIKLSDYRGKLVVLYFYPMDDTPGCTEEAKGFRDAYQSYEERNAIILGVSTQGNDSHRQFAKEYGLPFQLVADEDGSIALSYGAKSLLGLANRMTFIIDRYGKVVKVYGDVSPENHAKEVLSDVDRLLKKTPSP